MAACSSGRLAPASVWPEVSSVEVGEQHLDLLAEPSRSAFPRFGYLAPLKPCYRPDPFLLFSKQRRYSEAESFTVPTDPEREFLLKLAKCAYFFGDPPVIILYFAEKLLYFPCSWLAYWLDADILSKIIHRQMTDDEKMEWELKSLRDEISLDWAKLASKDLTPDRRKAIREHLALNVAALRDLVERNETASHRLKLERFRSLRKFHQK